jgi:hypothetical protein
MVTSPDLLSSRKRRAVSLSRKQIDPQFQVQYLSEVLLKYHKVQIIPQRSATTLVTVRKRSRLSGQGITSPFIPRDQRRSYIYDRHANTMCTALSGEIAPRRIIAGRAFTV